MSMVSQVCVMSVFGASMTCGISFVWKPSGIKLFCVVVSRKAMWCITFVCFGLREKGD